MSKQKDKSDFKAKSIPELQERGVIVMALPEIRDKMAVARAH